MDQLIDMNEEDTLAEINLEDTQLQAQKSTIEDVDDMCKEDDAGKTTSASRVGSSRSEGSSVPP
ncbi:hypothetical protein HID58_074977 [Brassica napus]|uniref:Uncharacterized protein n=1 Tax=Brassica napus TaxID=3708 RepID=A0ABQ7YID9_BRANA|nr:hypothetical protein HID58_074977 [Brassica napus]